MMEGNNIETGTLDSRSSGRQVTGAPRFCSSVGEHLKCGDDLSLRICAASASYTSSFAGVADAGSTRERA